MKNTMLRGDVWKYEGSIDIRRPGPATRSWNLFCHEAISSLCCGCEQHHWLLASQMLLGTGGEGWVHA